MTLKKDCADITNFIWFGVHKELTSWTSVAGHYSLQVDDGDIDAKMTQADSFLHETVFVNCISCRGL